MQTNVRAISIGESAPPAIAGLARPSAGRVAFIGRPFPKWPEIRRGLAERNFEMCEADDAGDSMSDDVLARANLVIIGGIEWPREAHEVCAEVRRRSCSVPILLLTDACDTVGRILGLENGADAWAAADADARVSLAQIRALLRREVSHGFTYGSGAAPAGALRVGNFLIHPASRRVVIGREHVTLTALEYTLLWNLMQRAGQAISRGDLAGMVGYSGGKASGRAIDTLVRRLRMRIGEIYSHQIRSVHSFGYMLYADEPHTIGRP